MYVMLLALEYYIVLKEWIFKGPYEKEKKKKSEREQNCKNWNISKYVISRKHIE